MCHSTGQYEQDDWAFHVPSPAEAPISPAASLIQLRIEAIPLGGPNAGLAPAAAAF